MRVQLVGSPTVSDEVQQSQCIWTVHWQRAFNLADLYSKLSTHFQQHILFSACRPLTFACSDGKATCVSANVSCLGILREALSEEATAQQQRVFMTF